MTRQAFVAVIVGVLAVGILEARATAPVADLTITNTDGVSTYKGGSYLTYTIVVGNAGPDAAAAATVSDPVTQLPQVLNASWTCLSAGGATCTSGPVAGDLVDTINLPVGGTSTYTLLVKTRTGSTTDLVNTATVTPPVGTTDPGLHANTAVDTDTATATILYVAATGGVDSPTCGPSATPCAKIQTAIEHASAGDAVIVHDGTYKECIALVPGVGLGGVLVESNQFLTTGLVGAVSLDGAGVCDSASLTPGPVATVFDGSALRGFVIQHGGDSGVSGRGAVTIANNAISDNTTSPAVGDIRLTTGLDLSPNDPLAKAEIKSNTIVKRTLDSHGAGIYVDATGDAVPSVVEIDANAVTTNTTGGTVSVFGSGIAVFTNTTQAAASSSVVITGNTLDGNIAPSDGGGIFVATGSSSGLGTERVTIGATKRGNALRNNVAYGLGGGMSIRVQPAPGGKHTVDVVENNVSANTGKHGGGGLHLRVDAVDRVASSTPDLVLRASGNTLIGNHAQGDLSDPNAAGGGGIYAELHSARTVASALVFEVSGNTIERNDATSHGGGASLLASADDDPLNDGDIRPADAIISFHNNLVAKNAARDTTAGGPSGGGIHAVAKARGGAALARVSQSFLTVADNETELGTGGLEWEDHRLPDSTLALGTTSFELSNSIVVGNDGYGVGSTIPLDPATAVDISYTDAFGNTSGNYQPPMVDPTGDAFGNISEDAKLDANFLPRLCGPVVDRGDPTIPATNEPLPNGGRVNLGHLGNTASATRTFPDVNGDDTIDGLDVLVVAVSFNSCNDSSCSDHSRYTVAADRDLNHRVDGEDLAYVSAFYGQSCPVP